MVTLPVCTLPRQVRTLPFFIFSTKAYDTTGFFDWISIYRRAHTRRIVSYRRLPLPTYPPEMNGTAAWATDCPPANRYDGLHGVHYRLDSTPQRRAPIDDSGRIPLPASLAILFDENHKLPSSATLLHLSSCLGSSPTW
jgi:hypothetical protein